MKTLIISLFISVFLAAGNPDEIIGNWNAKNNEAVVEIYKKDRKYFAKLVALKSPIDTDGKPKRDTKNKDAKLNSRNLQGILIFWNMEYSAQKARWEKGIIYNPENGLTGNCIVTLIDENTLNVKGYIGFEWLSHSQIWKRKVAI